MSAADVKLVQGQAAKVVEKLGAEGTGVALFGKMFSKNPKLVEKFTSIKQAGAPYDGTNAALKGHGGKIVENLVEIISAASVPAQFDKACLANAQRHKPMGITKAEFDFVRDCLVEALSGAMGSAVDGGAWGRVFDAVSALTLKLYAKV